MKFLWHLWWRTTYPFRLLFARTQHDSTPISGVCAECGVEDKTLDANEICDNCYIDSITI